MVVGSSTVTARSDRSSRASSRGLVFFDFRSVLRARSVIMVEFPPNKDVREATGRYALPLPAASTKGAVRAGRARVGERTRTGAAFRQAIPGAEAGLGPAHPRHPRPRVTAAVGRLRAFGPRIRKVIYAPGRKPKTGPRKIRRWGRRGAAWFRGSGSRRAGAPPLKAPQWPPARLRWVLPRSVYVGSGTRSPFTPVLGFAGR